MPFKRSRLAYTGLGRPGVGGIRGKRVKWLKTHSRRQLLTDRGAKSTDTSYIHAMYLLLLDLHPQVRFRLKKREKISEGQLWGASDRFLHVEMINSPPGPLVGKGAESVWGRGVR
jgi:hypothetical protein